MKNDKYLYGTDEVPAIPEDVIMRRVELLKDNLEKLLDHSYYTRDTQRCNDIIKAIKFWEDMRYSITE